jgi:hypothetical protein
MNQIQFFKLFSSCLQLQNLGKEINLVILNNNPIYLSKDLIIIVKCSLSHCKRFMYNKRLHMEFFGLLEGVIVVSLDNNKK